MRSVLTGVVLPAVLVLGAAGGGIAYTAATVDGADRTVPTEVWADAPKKSAEDPSANAWRGRTSTPLSKLLLPVPEGYRLGPDMGEYGNDSELSAKQAVALMKESGRSLTGNARRNFDKEVDKLGIQGVAIRSMATEFAERGGVYEEDVVITVHILRMKNEREVREAFELRKGLVELLDFRKGPRISGHKNSACFLPPVAEDSGEDEDEQLGAMLCLAYDSDLLVSIGADGSAPFDKDAVADLVQEQLDHIASPGEYV